MNETIVEKFSAGIRWNVAGSMIYETLKITHQVILFHVLSRQSYGLMGILFSIVYLTTALCSIGSETALPAFLSLFTKNKSHFRYLVPRYMAPQIPLLLCGGAAATFIYFTYFFTKSHTLPLILPLLLIFFEGLRIFFRMLLHSVFMHKQAMIIEISIITLYMASVWIIHGFYHQPLTLNLIFIPYLIGSIIAILSFLFLTMQFYLTLPEGALILPPSLFSRIFKTRFFNYGLNFTKYFFSANFLVPLIGLQLGLAQASVIKFASYIADTVKSVIHVVIGFSGGALLATIKESTPVMKQNAFKMVSEKLTKIVAFVLIFLVCNYPHLLSLNGSASLLDATLIPSGLFLLIIFLEHFEELYAVFYTVEELASIPLLFKGGEIAIAGLFVLSTSLPSPTHILISVVMVKVVGISLLASAAWNRWSIYPRLGTTWRFVTLATIFSLGIWYLVSIIEYGNLFAFFTPYLKRAL